MTISDEELALYQAEMSKLLARCKEVDARIAAEAAWWTEHFADSLDRLRAEMDTNHD